MGNWDTRIRILVSAVAASAIFTVALVVSANSNAAVRVADNASELQWSNATLGTSALARAAAGQASLFQDLTDSGQDIDSEALVASLAELDAVTAGLSDLSPRADMETRDDIDSLLVALATRPVDFASVDLAYQSLATSMGTRIAALEDAIDSSQVQAERVFGALRVVLTLIIPLSAVFLFRRKAATQVRETRIRAETELAAEREIARAKDGFVAGLSHEMRTPLTGIFGFSEILLASNPIDEGGREFVTEIHHQASDLARMVDDFIAMSRLDSDTINISAGPMDLSDLCGSVSEQFSRQGLPVPVNGTARLALADEPRVRQILVNLISNSFRHGGDVAAMVLRSDEGNVYCDVIDNGPGVPDEMVERLFTRFIHTGEEVLMTGSHGLGTWVARTLAQRMGGDVSYERKNGRTVFTLTLPRMVAPPVVLAPDEELAVAI